MPDDVADLAANDAANDAADLGGYFDPARMRRDRFEHLRRELAARDLDALVLLGSSAVAYATGAWAPVSDATTADLLRPVAVVHAGADHPHLFTPFPEGAPPELPGDHVHPPLCPHDPDGVTDMGRRLAELCGGDVRHVGVDELTGAMHAALGAALAGSEAAEAGPVMGAARVCKTRDELECIRRAQHINELAMDNTWRIARPGTRQSELTARFLRRILELGADGWALGPVWQVMPTLGYPSPATTHGGLAFPLTSTDRILRDGDVLWVDAGVVYQGYVSDFARTWPVTIDGSASPAQRSEFDRWKAIVDAALAVTRAGASGAELTAAAREAAGGQTPWPAHLYLAHGIGLDRAEAPLVGSDLGPGADESLVLAPGMVLVFEPELFDPSTGGYRGARVVAVTEGGYEALSNHHHYPYDQLRPLPGDQPILLSDLAL